MDGIRDLLTDICLVGAAATSVAWVMLINRGRMARAADRIAKTSRSAVAAFLFFAAIATVCAQKSGTNEPPRGASSPRVIEPGPSVTPDDVERGYMLESVTTNAAYSYAMPTNGTRYEKWWRRGAYEDVFRLDFGDFRFPLGTYMCDYLWAYTWGMAGARLRDASNRVVATGVPMSAVPRRSRFWSAADEDGSRLLTWQDFALGRDTNELVSAQLELFPSGDYIARSNLVERVYRRVNPDDWDDDGDPNDTDPNPYVHDGDSFGPHPELPQGANSNAYCWVDIVVSNANALVTFTGDGPSALPDPRFIARAGETNRVTILIGKAYQVTCPMPIACVGQSSCEIEIYQDQYSPTEMYICWPVSIEAVSMRSGASFSMSVTPDCLGGGFVWTNSCCSVSGTGWSFVYSCGGTCTCTGCGALGYYGYEGYRISADGGLCGCGSQSGDGDGGEEEDDDGPYDAGASVSFSKSAVIFEDRYENTPGVWVERQSTQTELHCVAHGGPNGGHVRFEIVGEEKLQRVSGILLPFESDIGAGKKIDFTITYNGKQPSYTTNDIVVTSTFTENVPGAQSEVAEEKLTSVQVWFTTAVAAPLNNKISRHNYGVCEIVNCGHQPYLPDFSWVPLNGGTMIEAAKYRCPLDATPSPLVVRVGQDIEYPPAMRVYEPNNIEIRNTRPATKGFSPGHAGGIGMLMDIYILPLGVSFTEIAVEEVPCSVGVPTGYFSFPAMAGVASHTTQNGAGTWCNVQEGNKMGVDRPGIYGELLPMTPDGTLTNDVIVGWLEGTLYWPTPFGWNVKGTTGSQPEHKQFATWVAHETWIHSDGSCGVRKFQNLEASRDIGTNIWFNGQLWTKPCEPL